MGVLAEVVDLDLITVRIECLREPLFGGDANRASGVKEDGITHGELLIVE